MTSSIGNPILKSPYEQPDRQYEVGPQDPTGEIRGGRRPSESFILIAISRKKHKGAPSKRPSASTRQASVARATARSTSSAETRPAGDGAATTLKPESGKIAVKVIDDYGDES